MFDLRNDESVRRVSGNPEPISFETHSAWFAKKLTLTTSRIFIIEEQESPIAQTRFDLEGNGSAVISIAVIESHRGKGYGSRIIREATDTFFKEYSDVFTIRALINPGNEASLKSFAKAGYERKGESEEGGIMRHLLVFSRGS